MSTQIADKSGLFLAKYNIGTGMMGAPDFQVVLTVNTVDKEVNGMGRITQAVNPPVDVRTRIDGRYFEPIQVRDVPMIQVSLTGYPVLHAPSVGRIGIVLLPNVYLSMMLSADWKSGTASYRYHGADEQWHEVSGVPVKLD
ncbi:MAG TPA: DUF1842 domain-containing protein [Polyangia bacterium]|jgi:hypothetical protein|nr:DUF1842 domain-containing protein [Polyangia bacterium]